MACVGEKAVNININNGNPETDALKQKVAELEKQQLQEKIAKLEKEKEESQKNEPEETQEELQESEPKKEMPKPSTKKKSTKTVKK